MPELHDISCVVHAHSVYSDGTGTVPEIARAAERTGAEAVLLTDHDTLAPLRAGEERYHGRVLVLVGHEVTPPNRNHMLVFDTPREIAFRGRSAAKIAQAVRDAGAIGIAAHPFATGSKRFGRLGSLGTAMAWDDLDCLDALEVWNFLSDNGGRIASARDALHFVAAPARFVTHPPQRNLDAWDRLGAHRRVVGIGGLDAHQFGRRIAGRVVRLMGYKRSFRQLRTHMLLEEPLTGSVEHDRAQIYDALREGRCYIAAQAVAPAGGFDFRAVGAVGELMMGAEARHDEGPWRLEARLPQAAAVRVLRDGQEIARAQAVELAVEAPGPGVYRVEARRVARGAERTWILSNPIYLRGEAA